MLKRGQATQRLAAAILDRARQEAAEQRRSCSWGHKETGPIGTVRRKYLIHQARRLAERYGLQEDLQGWIYAADCVELTGLDLVELDALVSWLRGAGDRMDHACDRADTPPAR